AWESWPPSGRNGYLATAPAPAPNKPLDLAGERAPNHHIGGLTPSFSAVTRVAVSVPSTFFCATQKIAASGFKRLGSSATSHSTPSSGNASFNAVTARQTKLPGSSALLPSGSFSPDGTAGKTATTGIPNPAASPAASTSAGIGNRNTSGIEGIGSLCPSSWTKTGQIRSPAVRMDSATSLRDHGSRRLRRRRVCG